MIVMVEFLDVPDEVVKKCASCGTDFGAFVRRVHTAFFVFVSQCSYTFDMLVWYFLAFIFFCPASLQELW